LFAIISSGLITLYITWINSRTAISSMWHTTDDFQIDDYAFQPFRLAGTFDAINFSNNETCSISISIWEVLWSWEEVWHILRFWDFLFQKLWFQNVEWSFAEYYFSLSISKLPISSSLSSSKLNSVSSSIFFANYLNLNGAFPSMDDSFIVNILLNEIWKYTGYHHFCFWCEGNIIQAFL
jgi:hypothetical protein